MNQLAKFFIWVAIIAFLIVCLAIWSSQLAWAEELSPNFHKSEFNQKRSPLALADFEISPTLIMRLEKLRLMIDKPIIITSGYRSPAYNKKVGGVKRSQHLLGKAADIKVRGMKSTELQKYARKAGFTFTQIYKHLPHLHVDVR